MTHSKNSSREQPADDAIGHKRLAFDLVELAMIVGVAACAVALLVS